MRNVISILIVLIALFALGCGSGGAGGIGGSSTSPDDYIFDNALEVHIYNYDAPPLGQDPIYFRVVGYPGEGDEIFQVLQFEARDWEVPVLDPDLPLNDQLEYNFGQDNENVSRVYNVYTDLTNSIRYRLVSGDLDKDGIERIKKAKGYRVTGIEGVDSWVTFGRRAIGYQYIVVVADDLYFHVQGQTEGRKFSEQVAAGEGFAGQQTVIRQLLEKAGEHVSPFMRLRPDCHFLAAPQRGYTPLLLDNCQGIGFLGYGLNGDDLVLTYSLLFDTAQSADAASAKLKQSLDGSDLAKEYDIRIEVAEISGTYLDLKIAMPVIAPGEWRAHRFE